MKVDYRRNHPWLLTLLCVMLLVSRVSEAHLHLCFDGVEPRTAVHILDNGLHHGASGFGAEHQDVDIAVADDVLIKFAKLGLDLLIQLAVLLICGLLLTMRRPAPGPRNPFCSSTAYSLRPPLRGPPRLNSL